MKKLAVLILMFFVLVSGCQSGETKKETGTNKSVTATTSKKAESEKRKLFKQNEEAFITNKDGEKVYSLTINSAKRMNVPADDVEDMPKGTKKLLVITYTFKYLNEDKKMTSLNISPWDLQVYDEKGMSIDFIDFSAEYPFDSDIYLTDGINPGRSKQVYGVFSLKDDTKTIQIEFNSHIFNEKFTFEIPVEESNK